MEVYFNFIIIIIVIVVVLVVVKIVMVNWLFITQKAQFTFFMIVNIFKFFDQPMIYN